MAGALGAILVTEMASVTAWHDTYLRQPDRRSPGLESASNLDPRACGVESTSRNCLMRLRKRVADSKHGFRSRLKHVSKMLSRQESRKG